MEEIAREAEFAEGTLYNFFKGKIDLYLSLIEEKSKELLDHLHKQASKTIGAGEKIRCLIKAQMGFFDKNRNFFKIFVRERNNFEWMAQKDRNRRLSKVYQTYIDFVAKTIKDDLKHGEFEKKHGFKPPGFVTISPGKRCNLRCAGCYAGSSDASAPALSFEVWDRMMEEKKKLWGSYFTVISGGEPLLYRSDGKDLFDIAKKHSDNFFLMYTNGTLIDEDMAGRLADAGNITPAISVEGFEKETDERRGKGVHKKILRAFANLRNVGVPFGISRRRIQKRKI